MTTPEPIGRHVLADLSGIDPERLRDVDGVMGALGVTLGRLGFHVLRRVHHRFPDPGGGFTGVFLLSESHAAVHTYPEHGYLALDVFGCGPQDPCAVAEALADELDARHRRIRESERRFEPFSADSRPH